MILMALCLYCSAGGSVRSVSEVDAELEEVDMTKRSLEVQQDGRSRKANRSGVAYH